MTEANLQAEGLREEPAQRAVDRWEMEEEDSSPHGLALMWSPVQRLPTGHLNTNYCLSIQVILTDELGRCATTFALLDDTSDRRYVARD